MNSTRLEIGFNWTNELDWRGTGTILTVDEQQVCITHARLIWLTQRYGSDSVFLLWLYWTWSDDSQRICIHYFVYTHFMTSYMVYRNTAIEIDIDIRSFLQWSMLCISIFQWELQCVKNVLLWITAQLKVCSNHYNYFFSNDFSFGKSDRILTNHTTSHLNLRIICNEFYLIRLLLNDMCRNSQSFISTFKKILCKMIALRSGHMSNYRIDDWPSFSELQMTYSNDMRLRIRLYWIINRGNRWC